MCTPYSKRFTFSVCSRPFPVQVAVLIILGVMLCYPAFAGETQAPAQAPAASAPKQPAASVASSSDKPAASATPPTPDASSQAAAPAPAATDDDDDIGANTDPQAAVTAYTAKAAAAQSRLEALPSEIADEALRARVAEQWKEAVGYWQAAAQAADQLMRRRQTIDGAAARLQAIQGEIEALREKATGDVVLSDSLSELEAELRELDLNLPEWTKQQGQRAARIDSQAQRLAESRQHADEAQARLSEKGEAIQESLPPELKTAMREARTARRRADHEIVASSEYYRNIQDPLVQLDVAERDLLSRRIEFGRARREALAAGIADKRRAEAEALRRESDTAAQRFLDYLPPSFRELAEKNRELSKILDQVLEAEMERSQFLQVASGYIQGLQADFDRISEQLKSGGGGQALGAYLWAKRGSLQREVYQAGQSRDRFAASAAIPGLTFGNLNDLRRQIPRLEKELAAFSNDPAITKLSPSIRTELQERARTLLDNHTKLVASLSESASRQTASLIDMDSTNKELRRISERYTSLVDRYVLHLPGSPPLWHLQIPETIKAVWKDLTGASLFRNTVLTFFQGILYSPILILFLILAVAPTAILRAVKGWFNVSARAPVPGTPRGLLWRTGNSLLRSYPAPLLLFTAGAAIWCVARPGSDVAAVGDAFLAGTLPWLLLNLWRRFCDPENVLELYTGMPRPIIDRLHRRLTSVLYIGLPLWIATWFIQNHAEPPFYQAFGCMMSTVLATLAGGFWFFRMRPAVLMRGSDAYKSWFWQILHLVIMALCILWLVLSVMGYNYGALLVIAKATASGLIVTAISVFALYWRLHLTRSREVQRARAILYHRFKDNRRNNSDDQEKVLSLDKTAGIQGKTSVISDRTTAQDNPKTPRQQTPSGRQEIQTATDDEPGDPDGELLLVHRESQDKLTSPAVAAAAASIPPAVEKELEASLRSARRLIRWLFVAGVTVLLLVQWSDLFPVQNWLSRLTLISRESAKGLTLLDVVRALAGGWLCYSIASPLGAWVNLSFFGWDPAERGTRMATLSLVRYAMLGIGIVWAAHELGIAWSDAQWLVAALSVGLGFGLQEIILNFVSGIILLFERPVRVGDVVSIGGAEGTINRINIRTTTITDFDKRELIIPNKELVTSRVVNWTLSDSITRMVIPVGVAYGSDLEKVQRLLLDAANSLDAVLRDPGPSVYLVGMGDNGLNFELRVFTSRLEDRMPTQHQLRLLINQIFQKNNIVIPFPQVDVHIAQ